jgi:hypothetical protein
MAAKPKKAALTKQKPTTKIKPTNNAKYYFSVDARYAIYNREKAFAADCSVFCYVGICYRLYIYIRGQRERSSK